MVSKVVVIFLLFSLLLVSASVSPDFRPRTVQTVSAQIACPANQIIHMTLFPLVASMNFLTSTTYSGYVLSALQYWTVYPYATNADGSLYWNDSMTNVVTHNANYTQWDFHVTPGLKWSNGQNVTGQDILNTYSPNYALNSTYDLVNVGPEIASSSLVNTSTAQFNLNASDAHFAERISMMIFENVQPQASIAQGVASNLFNQSVSVGPFYLGKPYTSGDFQLIFYRNPYFKPQPAACELDVNLVESTSQISQYLSSGTTDVAGSIDPSSVSADVKNPNIHILDEKALNIMTLQYNVTVYPYNMTAFRQALVYGIDQSKIQSQALFGYGTQAYNSEGIVPPNQNQLYNANEQQYSYNTTKALQLLSSIGITKGSDGMLHYPNGTVATLNLVSDSEQTFDVVAAGLTKADLTSLGFNVNFQTISSQTITGDFPTNAQGIQQAMILYTSIGGTFFPNAWIDSTQGCHAYLLSYGVGCNQWEAPPSADAQYNSNKSALDNTSDPAQVNHYLANIQALNAQYLPVIVLNYPDNLYAYNTQHWTNWPSRFFYAGSWLNDTALAALQPASGSTTNTNSSSTQSSTSSTTSTSTSSGAASTSSSAPAVSSTSSGASSASSTTTSSVQSIPTTTSSSSSTSLSLSYAAVVVVVMIVVAGAFFLRRGRVKPAT